MADTAGESVAEEPGSSARAGAAIAMEINKVWGTLKSKKYIDFTTPLLC